MKNIEARVTRLEQRYHPEQTTILIRWTDRDGQVVSEDTSVSPWLGARTVVLKVVYENLPEFAHVQGAPMPHFLS